MCPPLPRIACRTIGLSGSGIDQKSEAQVIYTISANSGIGEPSPLSGWPIVRDIEERRYELDAHAAAPCDHVVREVADDGQLLVRSLAKSDAAPSSKITKVSLLGYKGTVEWSQTHDGLSVKLPAQKLSPYTCALKITGTELKHLPLKEESSVLQQDADGSLVLPASAADIHGEQLNTEERDEQANLGFWDKPADWVSWKVQIQKPGKFAVSASVATVNEGAEVALEAGDHRTVGQIPRTGDWGAFQVADLGVLEISAAGEQIIKLHPKDAATWKPINLRFIRLVRKE